MKNNDTNNTNNLRNKHDFMTKLDSNITCSYTRTYNKTKQKGSMLSLNAVYVFLKYSLFFLILHFEFIVEKWRKKKGSTNLPIGYSVKSPGKYHPDSHDIKY